MSPKRIYYLMIGLVVLLCLAVIGLAVMGDLAFNKKSEELSGRKAKNQAIKEQEVSLAQAKADIEQYRELNEIAKSVVPQDKDQAKTVREINTIASQSGIKLEQINFDASTLGGSSTGSSSSSSSSTSSTSASSSGRLSQVKPVPGISGVYALEITVNSGADNTVSYYEFLRFLERLESNRRTAHVTSITVTPSEDNRNNVSFTLTLNAYLKP